MALASVDIYSKTIIFKQGKVLGQDAAESLKVCVHIFMLIPKRVQMKRKTVKNIVLGVILFTLVLPTFLNDRLSPNQSLNACASEHWAGALDASCSIFLQLILSSSSQKPFVPLFSEGYGRKKVPLILETDWSQRWRKMPFWWWICQRVCLGSKGPAAYSIPSDESDREWEDREAGDWETTGSPS